MHPRRSLQVCQQCRQLRCLGHWTLRTCKKFSSVLMEEHALHPPLPRPPPSTCCRYASSAGKVFGSLDAAEKKFNSVLMEERVKFKEETLVNVDGRRKTRKLDVKGGEPHTGDDACRRGGRGEEDHCLLH